jgi:hypothetical protein
MSREHFCNQANWSTTNRRSRRRTGDDSKPDNEEIAEANAAKIKISEELKTLNTELTQLEVCSKITTGYFRTTEGRYPSIGI